ncbi:MAG: mercuric reductase [Planctomycetaceae bacterium]|nr:mercuric reductase [Planctomycetaceae bacterium]
MARNIPELLPSDSHNQRLAGNVLPPERADFEPAKKYNLVVLGAGTAGLVTAMGAAGLGAKVALVERNLMGGDCLNVGCVPSKALISASRVMAHVSRAGESGVRVPAGTKVDFPAVMERMRRLRADISRNDSVSRFREAGIDVFGGEASFVDGGTVAVGPHLLKFSRAAICTGARAAIPPIPGLREAGCLTNETIFSLTELPPRLVIIGGGPIGCELAQCFARFGSQVTILETGGGVLHREDQDAAELIQQALVRDGVRILTDVRLEQVRTSHAEEGGTGEKLLSITRGGETTEIPADEILVAAGRQPNVERLNLTAAGVEFDQRSGVTVNDRLQTTSRRIFAAGDVCSRWKFTHTADFLARIVIGNSLFFGRSKASRLVVPWCTYTSPEVAHVGLYEKEAREQGIAIDTYTQQLADVDRAILDGETTGFVRVHVQKGTDKILGATIVAGHAGDLISEITVAMRAGAGLKTIGSTIHPYPTQAEAIRRLGDQFNRTRLTPLVASLMKWFLGLRR